MGVFDKLKNVFFEEEYVEVEEPAKPIRKERTTIAKKVELPDMPKIKEEKSARERKIEEEVIERVEKKGISENSLLRRENNFKFPMSFEEEDFTADIYNEPKKEKTAEKPKTGVYSESAYSYNHTSKNESFQSEHVGYGLYEGPDYKKEQKVFRPTPIISPIYGVLDKNYKKDEIVQKKEVRISSTSSKKIDLDSIREKAYGDLASDITASMMEGENESDNVDDAEKDPPIEDSLYDLNDNDHPVVSSVTMGDAEEYFNDLGLEYNVDYKDHKKEKATGRRSDKTRVESSNNDSLFDLIDSMYKDSDEEEEK